MVGFKFVYYPGSIERDLDKLEEEVREVREAYVNYKNGRKHNLEEELADVMQVVLNISCKLGLDLMRMAAENMKKHLGRGKTPGRRFLLKIGDDNE